MIANNLSLAPMTAEDIVYVANTEKENFATPWDEAALCRSLSDSAENFFVAKYQGRCVGYIGILDGMETADIITLCVSGEYRGQGIATALLQYVFLLLKKNGTEKVFLEVRESNAPARTLYERFGFTYLNKRVKYYKEPVEDAWVMIKEIASENFKH